MKNILDRYVNRYERKHKDFRRYAAIVAVLALIVFVGVNWRLHDKGISMTSDYQCGLKEHKHTEKCYKKVLICGKEETDGSEGHTHTASCYKEEQKLTCDKEEHKHTADCYDEEGNLICDKEEHTHSKDCYTTEKKLVCGKEESKPVKAHHHTDACYKKELVCKLKEHTHTAACYSNESADVETESDWKATIPTLSGNWAEDIVSVAQSQLGYEESTANFKLADDGKTRNGYTRYGEWYGNKYGDWSAMFASFCLNYAGIPSKTVPVNSGSIAWITELKQKNLYKAADNAGGDYNPTTGDLVFLDTDSDGKADHVGIITETETKDNKADSKVTSLKAIVGDSDDKVEGKTYKTGSDVIVGYCALPENPDAEKADTETLTDAKTKKASGETAAATESEKVDDKGESREKVVTGEKAESTTAISEDTTAITKVNKISAKNNIVVQNTDGVAVQSVSGLDMTDYVTEVKLSKKVGQLWEESSEFTTSDSVKAEISFANVPKTEWKKNNNTAYIKLPEGFDCSKFAGQTYEAYDNGKQSGTYTYEKDAEGHWNIVLKLFDDYVNKVVDGGNIGGNIDLKCQWDEKASSEEGKKENITIGKWTGTVTVKKDTKQDTGETGYNFSILKKADDVVYDKATGAYYITYTVELTVKKNVTAPIDLTDNLTGNDWIYDGDSLKLTQASNGENPTVSWISNETGNSSTDKKATISIGKAGETIKAGTYTFTYKVKNTKISNATDKDNDSVHNKVFVPDNDKTISSEKWTNITTGKVNKQGTLVVGEDGNTYIDYIVYLNAGDIVKNLTEGAKFKDTLPDDLELKGDVTVEQYDATGEKQGEFKANVQGNTISYITPTGQYYYVIKYRAKVKSENIPIGGKDIVNTGESDGGIKGDSSSKVTIPNSVLSKNFDSQKVSQDADGKWINTMKWTSTISVDGSLKNYVYEDWGQTAYINNQDVAFISMSPEQRKNIKIFDKNGNEIKSGYSIEESDYQYKDVKTGLFKIIFTDDINGPVTIQYETTADLSGFAVGTWMEFINYASLTDGDGNTDKTQAKSNNIQYTHEKPGIIFKKRTDSWEADSSNITLKPGETTIPWTIVVNRSADNTVTGELVITDNIADGMTLVESSLNIKIWSEDIKDKVDYTYDEKSHTLIVKVPEKVYHGINNKGEVYSNPITISYRTELPKEYLTSGDLKKQFSNTASVDINGEQTDSSFTQEVTRQVVGKSGKYDKTTKTLTYEMILNPDASKLNDGNSLTVKDSLAVGALKGNIELSSLKLFTVLKTKDSSNNTKVEPGKLEKVLTKSDSTENFNYQWDKTTGVFTTYIPDEKAYVLVAEYIVDNSNLAEDITLSNTVELIGSQTWSAGDNSATVSKKSSAETYTDGDSAAIVKHDSTQYNTVLNGAKFKLEKYENGTWTESATMITGKDSTGANGENGKAYTAVSRKVLYRLTEIEAPDGYKIDKTPTYFVLITEGTTFNIPDTISGDKKYSKDKVEIYTVESGDKKYAKIVIDRYDTREPVIEKGQLYVNKVWIDGAGEEIEDPIRLSNLEAKITLTKEKRKEYKVIFKCDGQSDKVFATGVKHGAYIFTEGWIADKWTNVQLPEGVTFTQISGGGNTGQVPIFKLGPITSDLEINSSDAYWGTGTFKNQEGGESSTETTSETVTLNKDTGWSWTWNDLELGDNITYTLTEENVNGYETTYELNKKALEKGTSFSLGLNGDKITVINTADSSYVLPETGGIGTLPFITIGVSLMGFALLCGYSMRRRRESERRVE